MTSSREPVVLPQGYTLTPVMSNAEQAQLVESRTWNAETTAMLLGIPGWKLGLPGPSMTYQNVETADIDFVRDCVDRYARPLAAAFGKWLMPRGVVVEFDYAGRMRADQRTTADVLTTYTGAGLMTTDEARSMLGRPPLASTGEEGTTPAGVPELTPEEVTQ
jgi:HK97 family phage portal protein